MERFYELFTKFHLMVTFYKIVVQLQNQDIDIDINH